MDREQLVKVIDFWQKTVEQGRLFPRAIVDKIDLKSKEVVDIVGPRRSGKSSVLKLLIQKIRADGNWLYINFEDPFFVENNSPQIIVEAVEVYKEYFDKSLKYLFFDEIQNIKQWETAVRKLRDSEQYKIFITGSSSKLLSSELSSLLSGRHLSYQLMPLSFAEFLQFKGVAFKDRKDVIIKESVFLNHFRKYLNMGGFPEIALSDNLELVKQYYNDIVQKDIVARYEVRDKNALEKMGIFLISNSAKSISIASLKKVYELSFAAAAAYLAYFKEAFLVFDLPQFSYSLKTQQKSLKKIYSIDTGLANAVSFKFSEDKGRLLENVVFLHLKRQSKEIYYYKDADSEVDFAIKEKSGKIKLIQVTWSLGDEKTKKRELKGLLNAMSDLKTKDGLILTFDETDLRKIGRYKIPVKPVWRWMLE